MRHIPRGLKISFVHTCAHKWRPKVAGWLPFMAVNIPETFGALLLGALLAAGLSGMVIIQSIIYFKLYPFDPAQLKTLVCVIWVLDMAHSVFICAAIWTYLIVDYGTVTDINSIPLSLALTITCTAILTFFVHCFFAQRIFRLSQFNWYITFPIAVLATFRLCSACVTSAEMIHLQSFTLFKLKFRWIFSLGLALSSSVDILITLSLFMLLRNSRTRSLSLNHIIDTLILYTFETGALTCAATITTMICWLSMNDNMVFMGLHFVIGKLYANSLLATYVAIHSPNGSSFILGVLR
ncbi:hypothetical protein BD779DRAFT_288582 [Infundibulicybe gibba]|nr:hypothetical protein BD779DRAFT_288582 [Infundibulicybe gibba]